MAAEASPLGLAMYPQDIAHAFAYLASDESMHVTGQVITVDAGLTMAPEIPGFHKIEPAFLGPAAKISDYASAPGSSEEHTSELQSIIRISYDVFCLQQKTQNVRSQDIN